MFCDTQVRSGYGGWKGETHLPGRLDLENQRGIGVGRPIEKCRSSLDGGMKIRNRRRVWE